MNVKKAVAAAAAAVVIPGVVVGVANNAAQVPPSTSNFGQGTSPRCGEFAPGAEKALRSPSDALAEVVLRDGVTSESAATLCRTVVDLNAEIRAKTAALEKRVAAGENADELRSEIAKLRGTHAWAKTLLLSDVPAGASRGESRADELSGLAKEAEHARSTGNSKWRSAIAKLARAVEETGVEAQTFAAAAKDAPGVVSDVDETVGWANRSFVADWLTFGESTSGKVAREAKAQQPELEAAATALSKAYQQGKKDLGTEVRAVIQKEDPKVNGPIIERYERITSALESIADIRTLAADAKESLDDAKKAIAERDALREQDAHPFSKARAEAAAVAAATKADFQTGRLIGEIGGLKVTLGQLGMWESASSVNPQAGWFVPSLVTLVASKLNIEKNLGGVDALSKNLTAVETELNAGRLVLEPQVQAMVDARVERLKNENPPSPFSGKLVLDFRAS